MNPMKSLLLILLFVSLTRFNLFAWTSSNEGVCYTMDTLTSLSPNINYNYETGMFEVHENIVILENDTEILPTTTNYLVLNNNYPNPFSNFTTISFEVAKPADSISLEICDSKGNLVREIIKDKNYS